MSSKMDEMEKNSIDSLARTVKTNLYIAGEMQFSDITNRDFFIKAYSEEYLSAISPEKSVEPSSTIMISRSLYVWLTMLSKASGRYEATL